MPAAPQGAGTLHPIYLVWSEIHTDLILPVRGVTVNWGTVLTGDDAPIGSLDGGSVAFGWGSESFYTEVPTLADISIGIVAKAMLFDATVMHVVPVANPELILPGNRLTMLVSAESLARIEQHVLKTFALRSDGHADPLPDASYGYGDAFYRAQGRYNPLRTCNQWTSEALRLAGVSVGFWTPFSQSITWMLGTDADAS